jgi:hypothetical protein
VSRRRSSAGAYSPRSRAKSLSRSLSSCGGGGLPSPGRRGAAKIRLCIAILPSLQRQRGTALCRPRPAVWGAHAVECGQSIPWLADPPAPPKGRINTLTALLRDSSRRRRAWPPPRGQQRPAVRRTGFMERHLRFTGSLRLDVGRTDHLAPLLGFIGEQLAEVGRRARKHSTPDISE